MFPVLLLIVSQLTWLRNATHNIRSFTSFFVILSANYYKICISTETYLFSVFTIFFPTGIRTLHIVLARLLVLLLP
jgi:hypothetical protein